MRAKIFQPFQRVWTPRTPDSNYDSYGETPVPSPIVTTAVQEAIFGKPDQLADQFPGGLNTSLTLVSGTYIAATAITGSSEAMGFSVKPASGTYTP